MNSKVSFSSKIPNPWVRDEKQPKKTFCRSINQSTFIRILHAPTETKKVLSPLSLQWFHKTLVNKRHGNVHRWDKKGSGWSQAALGTAPPRPGSLGCTWEITALHTSTLAKRRRERILRPITVYPHLGQTLGIVWNLQRPRKARRKERKRGERVRIKNSGRGSKAFGKPYAPFGKIGFPVDTSI